jgi:hypothetical protein
MGVIVYPFWGAAPHGHALDDVEDAYGRGNILGTVSQLDGVPTGAIIERGSNANGEYVRWADGTQICVAASVGAMTCDIASGSIYRSAIAIWTYPASFSGVPSVMSAVPANDSLRWASTYAYSTYAGIQHWRSGASVASLAASCIAIGRWYE